MINLQEIRKRANLTQNELAKILGITESAICQYESGKRTPNIHVAKKIAQALDCTVDDLLKEN